jgi:hypothetical protein
MKPVFSAIPVILKPMPKFPDKHVQVEDAKIDPADDGRHGHESERRSWRHSVREETAQALDKCPSSRRASRREP